MLSLDSLLGRVIQHVFVALIGVTTKTISVNLWTGVITITGAAASMGAEDVTFSKPTTTSVESIVVSIPWRTLHQKGIVVSLAGVRISTSLHDLFMLHDNGLSERDVIARNLATYVSMTMESEAETSTVGASSSCLRRGLARFGSNLLQAIAAQLEVHISDVVAVEADSDGFHLEVGAVDSVPRPVAGHQDPVGRDTRRTVSVSDVVLKDNGQVLFRGCRRSPLTVELEQRAAFGGIQFVGMSPARPFDECLELSMPSEEAFLRLRRRLWLHCTLPRRRALVMLWGNDNNNKNNHNNNNKWRPVIRAVIREIRRAKAKEWSVWNLKKGAKAGAPRSTTTTSDSTENTTSPLTLSLGNLKIDPILRVDDLTIEITDASLSITAGHVSIRTLIDIEKVHCEVLASASVSVTATNTVVHDTRVFTDALMKYVHPKEMSLPSVDYFTTSRRTSHKDAMRLYNNKVCQHDETNDLESALHYVAHLWGSPMFFRVACEGGVDVTASFDDVNVVHIVARRVVVSVGAKDRHALARNQDPYSGSSTVIEDVVVRHRIDYGHSYSTPTTSNNAAASVDWDWTEVVSGPYLKLDIVFFQLPSRVMSSQLKSFTHNRNAELKYPPLLVRADARTALIPDFSPQLFSSVLGASWEIARKIWYPWGDPDCLLVDTEDELFAVSAWMSSPEEEEDGGRGQPDRENGIFENVMCRIVADSEFSRLSFYPTPPSPSARPFRLTFNSPAATMVAEVGTATIHIRVPNYNAGALHLCVSAPSSTSSSARAYRRLVDVIPFLCVRTNSGVEDDNSILRRVDVRLQKLNAGLRSHVEDPTRADYASVAIATPSTPEDHLDLDHHIQVLFDMYPQQNVITVHSDVPVDIVSNDRSHNDNDNDHDADGRKHRISLGSLFAKFTYLTQPWLSRGAASTAIPDTHLEVESPKSSHFDLTSEDIPQLTAILFDVVQVLFFNDEMSRRVFPSSLATVAALCTPPLQLMTFTFARPTFCLRSQYSPNNSVVQLFETNGDDDTLMKITRTTTAQEDVVHVCYGGSVRSHLFETTGLDIVYRRPSALGTSREVRSQHAGVKVHFFDPSVSSSTSAFTGGRSHLKKFSAAEISLFVRLHRWLDFWRQSRPPPTDEDRGSTLHHAMDLWQTRKADELERDMPTQYTYSLCPTPDHVFHMCFPVCVDVCGGTIPCIDAEFTELYFDYFAVAEGFMKAGFARGVSLHSFDMESESFHFQWLWHPERPPKYLFDIDTMTYTLTPAMRLGLLDTYFYEIYQLDFSCLWSAAPTPPAAFRGSSMTVKLGVMKCTFPQHGVCLTATPFEVRRHMEGILQQQQQRVEEDAPHYVATLEGWCGALGGVNANDDVVFTYDNSSDGALQLLCRQRRVYDVEEVDDLWLRASSMVLHPYVLEDMIRAMFWLGRHEDNKISKTRLQQHSRRSLPVSSSSTSFPPLSPEPSFVPAPSLINDDVVLVPGEYDLEETLVLDGVEGPRLIVRRARAEGEEGVVVVRGSGLVIRGDAPTCTWKESASVSADVMAPYAIFIEPGATLRLESMTVRCRSSSVAKYVHCADDRNHQADGFVCGNGVVVEVDDGLGNSKREGESGQVVCTWESRPTYPYTETRRYRAHFDGTRMAIPSVVDAPMPILVLTGKVETFYSPDGKVKSHDADFTRYEMVSSSEGLIPRTTLRYFMEEHSPECKQMGFSVGDPFDVHLTRHLLFDTLLAWKANIDAVLSLMWIGVTYTPPRTYKYSLDAPQVNLHLSATNSRGPFAVIHLKDVTSKQQEQGQEPNDNNNNSSVTNIIRIASVSVDTREDDLLLSPTGWDRLVESAAVAFFLKYDRGTSSVDIAAVRPVTVNLTSTNLRLLTTEFTKFFGGGGNGEHSGHDGDDDGTERERRLLLPRNSKRDLSLAKRVLLSNRTGTTMPFVYTDAESGVQKLLEVPPCDKTSSCLCCTDVSLDCGAIGIRAISLLDADSVVNSCTAFAAAEPQIMFVSGVFVSVATSFLDNNGDDDAPTILICVESMWRLHNASAWPLKIKIPSPTETTESSKMMALQVDPGETVSLPFDKKRNNGVINVKPILASSSSSGGPGSIQYATFTDADVEADDTKPIICHGLGGKSYYFFSAGLRETTPCGAVRHTIRLMSVLSLTNLFPVPMKVSFKYSDTGAQDRDIVTDVEVASGETVCLNQVNPTRRCSMRVLAGATDTDTDSTPWVTLEETSKNKSSDDVLLAFKLSDTLPAIALITRHTAAEVLTGSVALHGISVYVPYWLENTTPWDGLQYFEGARPLLGKTKMYCPTGANWNPLHGQLGLGFDAAELARQSRFNYDVVNTEQTVTVVHKGTVYPLLVFIQVAPGKFSRTKIIRTVARFVIHNHHPACLHMYNAKKKKSQPLISVPSGESAPLVFSAADHPDGAAIVNHVCLSFDDTVVASPSISLNEMQLTKHRLVDPINRRQTILRVHVISTEEGAPVIVHVNLPMHPNFVLANHTFDEIELPDEAVIVRPFSVVPWYPLDVSLTHVTLRIGGRTPVVIPVSLALNDHSHHSKNKKRRDNGGGGVVIDTLLGRNSLVLCIRNDGNRNEGNERGVAKDYDDDVVVSNVHLRASFDVSFFDNGGDAARQSHIDRIRSNNNNPCTTNRRREVMFLVIENVDLSRTQYQAQDACDVTLSIENVQAENSLPYPLYDVVFCPGKIQQAGGEGEASSAFLVITITRMTPREGRSIQQVEAVDIAVSECSVRAEDTFIARMHLLLQNAGVMATATTSPSSREPPNVDSLQLVFVERLHITGFPLHVSYVSDSDFHDSNANPFLLLVRTLGCTVQHIEDATIRFAPLTLKHTYGVRDEVVDNVHRHMYRQLVFGMYAALGALEFLGNPVGLLGNVRDGVADVFVRQDVGGLGRHLVFGTVGFAKGISGSLGTGFARLSFDDDYVRARRQTIALRPKGIGEGVAEGAKALGVSLGQGLAGIVMKPIEGAKEDGTGGFLRGVGKGLVGVIAKPVTGVLDLVSHTSEGVQAAVTDAQTQKTRTRAPRALLSNIITPYDAMTAECALVLQLLEDGRLQHEFLDLWVRHESTVALFTHSHWIIVLDEETKQRTLMCEYGDIARCVLYTETRIDLFFHEATHIPTCHLRVPKNDAPKVLALLSRKRPDTAMQQWCHDPNVVQGPRFGGGRIRVVERRDASTKEPMVLVDEYGWELVEEERDRKECIVNPPVGCVWGSDWTCEHDGGAWDIDKEKGVERRTWSRSFVPEAAAGATSPHLVGNVANNSFSRRRFVTAPAVEVADTNDDRQTREESFVREATEAEPFAAPSSAPQHRTSETPKTDEFVLYENERYYVLGGWTSMMLPLDPPHWCEAAPNHGSMTRAEAPPHDWIGEWHVEGGDGEDADADGWRYGIDWNLPDATWSSKNTPLTMIRRRRWVRRYQIATKKD